MMNFPNPKDPQTVQVRICNLDNDCLERQFCSFNDKSLKHECIPNDKKLLYMGCLNTSKYNEFDKIESKSQEDHQSIKSCIDFTRRQKNKDGFYYNFMVFKNKKNSFVDPNTINIYLKCDKEVLMTMPSKDFFKMKCSDNQQNCILIPNKTFKSFVKSNEKVCGGKFSLDVVYSCENEDLENKFNIPFNPKNMDQLKIEIKCPVNIQDNRFQSNCTAAYFDTDNSNPGNFKYLDLLDKSVKPEDCVQPVYKVPRIVNDIDIYKQLMQKKKDNEIQDYNNMLDSKEEELNKIRMEKLKIKFKMNTGKDLNDDEARSMVEFNKYEYFQSGSEKPCMWKIHEHKNPFGDYVEENDIRQYGILVQGKFYLLEEAKQKACELGAYRFIWFSNSYVLENLRNQLYVFTPNKWSEAVKSLELDDIKKWKKVSDVYVGEPTNETEMYKEKFEEADSSLQNELKEKYNLFMNYIQSNVLKTDEKLDTNQNKIKELDDKITTVTQKIKMNQIQTKVNNEFLFILFWFLVILIFFAVFYYYYRKYKSN
jgi:hypothetical protein